MTSTRLASHLQSKYSQVIFDLDGTIVDLDLNWSYWKKVIHTKILAYEPGYDLSNISKYAPVLNSLSEKYGPKFSDELIEFIKEFEQNHLSGYTAKTDIVNTISNLSNINVYIWTSNTHSTTERVLSDLGIRRKIRQIVARDHVKKIKPDPEGFHLIQAAENLPADQFLLIGDSDYDRLAAANAGIGFMHVAEAADLV